MKGGLATLLEFLDQQSVNIEYGYAFTGKDVEGLLMRVDDPAKAVDVLKKAGLELIKGSEI